ncbi:GNAT family N-acetyltransferase [Hoyosella rhizosphaerae]|nr:GNAT family protein [Hoyosella rhizosphaerae]MBN4927018.1 GNAT family N-acetyltransferase [Hoyosella rhizosphaerae]
MISPFVPVADPRPVDTPWPDMVWPLPSGTHLHGAVVQLSPLRPDVDAPALFAALDHQHVWNFMPIARPQTANDLEALLRARAELPNWHQWVVRTVQEYRGVLAGSVVGMTSFVNASVSDARVEIGGTLYAPEVWGSAVNPETKLLLLSTAFDHLNVGRVELRTDTRNTRSQLAITRLGAMYEGTQRRYARRPDGTVRDTVLFSIVAEDWPTVRHNLVNRVSAFDSQAGGALEVRHRPHPDPSQTSSNITSSTAEVIPQSQTCG